MMITILLMMIIIPLMIIIILLMIIIIVIMLDVFTTLFIFIPMIFSSVFYFTSKLLKTHEYEKLLNAHEYELNTTKVSKFPSLIVLFT